MFGSTSSVTFTNNTVTVTHTGSGDAGDPLLDFATLSSSSDVTVAADTGGSVTVGNNTFDITSGTDGVTWEVIKCTGTKDISITDNSFDVKQSNTSAGEMQVIRIDTDHGTAKTHTIEVSGNNFKIDEKRGYGIYIRADSGDHSELNGNCRVTNNKVIGVDDFNTLSASGTGIYIQEVNSPTVSQNVLRNHYDGILINGCATPVITDNILEDVGDDADDAFAAVGLFVTNGSGGTIKRNKFIQSFNSNRTRGTSIRIDTQPGFTLSDNTFILKNLNSTNSYRYFRCNSNSGVNNSQFGGDATASTFSGNVYVNTVNNPYNATSVARAGTDSNVPLADYKTHVDPTAKYDPAMLTQNLSKGLTKPFLTNEVINIREF
jgi:parallel beta-helix repeat protein